MKIISVTKMASGNKTPAASSHKTAYKLTH